MVLLFVRPFLVFFLILCGALLGVEVRVACPLGFEPSSVVIKKARAIYKNDNMLKIYNDPTLAVVGSETSGRI